MTFMTEVMTVPRRAPQQKRGEETVQRILDAAGTLLCTIPLEFVTTSRIAKEAGLSVGALYRFYPDKQTIFDAVAVRHVAQFRECLEIGVMHPLRQEWTTHGPRINAAKFLEDVISSYVAYMDRCPDFRALALGQLISAGTKAREASPISGLPSVLKSFLLEWMRVPSTPELEMMLSVASEAGERLLAYAYEQPSREARARIIEEMKRMLVGYLFVRQG